jgi:hypothetical protein
MEVCRMKFFSTIATIATIATIVGIVAALALVFSDESTTARQLDNHYAAEYQQLRLEEAQAWQTTYEPLLQAVSAGAIVSVTAIAVLGAAALVYALALALVHAAAGLNPEHRYRVRELEAHKLVLMSDAQHRHPLPIQTLTYSPHYSNRIDQAAALPGDIARDAQPASVPSFADLLQQQRVGKGQPLLLGYAEGAEVAGSWLDLYSTAVAGLSGTGKTTSQRFFAVQTALHGARFAVCDPHYGTGADSLGGTLAPLLSGCGLCDIADADQAILETVRMIDDMGQRRMSGQDRDTTPVILWIDELTALLGHSTIGPQLSMLLEKIAQQYRKRHIYASCSGQIWTAARTTSELRDSFASVLAHRMKRQQARLLLPAEEAQQVERLPVGCALLWRTSGQVDTLHIPQTTGEDVQRVAGLLTASQPTMQRLRPMPETSQSEAVCMPSEKPVSSQDVASNGAAYHAPQGDTALSAEAARVYGLFLDGKSLAEIVYQVRGVKSNQGGKYQGALAEVQDLHRQAMQHPQAKAVGE